MAGINARQVKESDNTKIITLTEDNDTYSNTMDVASVDGGDDGDGNSVVGADATIAALGGNDSVVNDYAGVSVSGGDGSDTIYNYGANVSVDAGAGNDSIRNGGSNVTVTASAGDDLISLSSNAKNNLITYAEGNGNDTIIGLNATSTLQIGNGTTDYYPKATVGNDIIVRVGDEFVTLAGAVKLSTLNILGTEVTALTDNNDFYVNTVAAATILALGGDDTVQNGKTKFSPIDFDNAKIISRGESSVSIVGGSDNDNITNYGGYYATLTGDDGNDNILNYYGTCASISGGAGNDAVRNYYGDRATVSTDDGNDNITNSGNYVSVAGGAGNDSIRNFDGNFVTVSGGAGNDNISLSANSCKTEIQYTDGDGQDTVYGCNPSDTVNLTDGSVAATALAGYTLNLQTGNGSIRFVNTPAVRVNDSILGDLGSGTNNRDYITNFADNVTIDALAGNDTIANGGDYFSVNAGAGNDIVRNYGAYTTVDAGAGDDSVDNYTVAAFIDGGAGNDKLYTYKSSSVTLGGGAGNDSLVNDRGEGVSFNGSEGSDTLQNINGIRSTLKGGDYADFLYNTGYFNSLDGGTGNDYISNSGSYTTGDAGAGDDTVDNNSADYSTISGGAGNDVINNLYSDVASIDAGDGDDSVLSNSFFVTVDGGKGADQISLQASGHLIRYTAGDGNHTVFGFNESDTLTIAADSYSTKKSGSNVIVSVGDDSISLVGAAGKVLNFNSTNRTDLITLTKQGDIFRNNFANVTLNALEGDDFVQNYATAVTLNAGEGNDTLDNSADNVTLNGDNGNDYFVNDYATGVFVDGGAGNDYVHNNRGTNATLGGGAGNDTVYNYVSDYASIDGGAGHDSLYNFYSSSVTISGGKGNDSITNIYSENVTISGNAGNDFIDNTRSDNVSISGDAGNDSITNSGADVSVSGGEDSDTVDNSGARALILGELGDDYLYNTGDNATLDGGDGNDLIDNDGNNVSIAGGAGNDRIVLESSSSRALDTTVTGGAGNDTVYGNSIAGGSYDYEYGDGKDVIFGFNTASTLFIAGTSWTTAQSGNDIVVTVRKGSITLKDAADLSKVNIAPKTPPGYWTTNKTTAIYNDLDGKALIKVTHLNKDIVATDGKIDGIELSGFTVTLSDKVLDPTATNPVTITPGYVLALADDVSAPEVQPPIWVTKQTKTSTTATLNQITTEGYTCDGETITHSNETTKKLATLKDLAKGLEAVDGSIDGIERDGTIITLSNKVLDAQAVTLSGKGYTLALAPDVPAPELQDPSWIVSGKKSTTAKLKAKTSAGYSLANDEKSINYFPEKPGKTIVTLRGLRAGLTVNADGSIDGIAIDGTTVTLSEDVLDPTRTVTISGNGYTLALADDVTKNVTQPPTWHVNGSKATLRADTTAGYLVTNNATMIAYAPAATGKAIITLRGLVKDLPVNANGTIDGIKVEVDDTTVKLSENVLDMKPVTISGAKVKLPTGEVIDGRDYTLTLAPDVHEPEPESITWKISGTKATLKGNVTDGYTCDGKAITYARATTNQTLTTINGMQGGLTVNPDGTIDGIAVDGKTISLSGRVIGNKVTIGKNYAFDFAGDCNGTAIIGTGKADTISVEGANMTITGSGGNDSINLGGYGNTLVYNAGNGDDVIADFTSDDKIQIANGSPTVATNGTDAIVAVGNGAMKLIDAANLNISLVDANNRAIPYSVATDYLLADDTYTAAQLDALTETPATDYSIGKLDTTEPTALTANDVIVSYGSDK